MMPTTIPVITPLPPPPTPSDSPEVFASKSGVFVTAEVAMVPQQNELATWMNGKATQVSADALYAGQAADRAEAVDTNVGAQVAAAAAYANNAKASATAAEAAPGSIGNLALLYATALSM